jgi:hypothetical protein
MKTDKIICSMMAMAAMLAAVNPALGDVTSARRGVVPGAPANSANVSFNIRPGQQWGAMAGKPVFDRQGARVGSCRIC